MLVRMLHPRIKNISAKSKKKTLGNLTDSPNVMKKARKLLCGEIGGGSGCVEFAFGCSCHALSNHVKDMCAEPTIKKTLHRTIKLSQLFLNTHVSAALLEEVEKGMEEKPETIKSYSSTRWNGVAVLFRSVLANNAAIGNVFSMQKTCKPNARSLDLGEKYKAGIVMSFAMDGEYWAI